MEIKFDLINRISEGPDLVFWWTRVIDATNWLLLPFAFYDRRARVALLAWVVNIVIILALYNQFGYVRLLGLSHILAWTPLLLYLSSRMMPFMSETATGKYLYWLITVVCVSLIFDYIDVVRYFFGATNYAN